MDLSYIFHSVQGRNLLIASVIGIALVALVIFATLRGEKRFQAGKDDEH